MDNWIKPRLKISLTRGLEVLSICETEVKLKSDRMLSADEEFDLELALPDLSGKLRCKVKWCEKSSAMFNHGNVVDAIFENHTVSDQLAIRHYISVFLAEQKREKAHRKVAENAVGQEGRRARRVKVSSNIIASNKFQAVDISETGMQLHSTSLMYKGDRITFTINLDSGPQTLNAEVMWCRQESSVFLSGYAIGVRFEGISVNSQLRIRNYIASIEDASPKEAQSSKAIARPTLDTGVNFRHR